MEYFNYSRSVAAFAKKFAINARLAGERNYADELDYVAKLHRESEKFILPDNGFVLDDKEWSGLPNDEELRLPFKTICLEFRVERERSEDNPEDQYVMQLQQAEMMARGKKGSYEETTVLSKKRLVYVTENGDPRFIFFTPCFYNERDKRWHILPMAAIPKKDFRKFKPDGKLGVAVALSDDRIPSVDYVDEAYAVMNFLNALSCANVRVGSPKILKKAQFNNKSLPKGVLPFDSYRVLEIDVVSPEATDYTGQSEGSGERFRPREHVRRGHKRRYKSGKEVWINDNKVNEGIGHKVVKTYAIKAS